MDSEFAVSWPATAVRKRTLQERAPHHQAHATRFMNFKEVGY